jgi:hypothetical protein
MGAREKISNVTRFMGSKREGFIRRILCPGGEGMNALDCPMVNKRDASSSGRSLTLLRDLTERGCVRARGHQPQKRSKTEPLKLL